MADPTIHWSIGTFNIRAKDSDGSLFWKPRTGLLCHPFAIDYRGKDMWVVNHLRTGLMVWGFSNPFSAMKFIERILSLADWASVDAAMGRGLPLRSRISKIADECDPCVEDGLVAEEGPTA